MPEDLAVKMAEVEARSKSNTHRIETIERRQDTLDKVATAVEVLATRQGTVEEDLKEIKAGVNALKEKPAKRWDGMIDKVLFTLIGAFVAWIIAGLPGV